MVEAMVRRAGEDGVDLTCPYCRSRRGNVVVDSRRIMGSSSIRRRRECLKCGRRWTTYEVIEDAAAPAQAAPPPHVSDAARRELGVALGHLDRGEAAQARAALARLVVGR